MYLSSFWSPSREHECYVKGWFEVVEWTHHIPSDLINYGYTYNHLNVTSLLINIALNRTVKVTLRCIPTTMRKRNMRKLIVYVSQRLPFDSIKIDLYATRLSIYVIFMDKNWTDQVFVLLGHANLYVALVEISIDKFYMSKR